MLIGIRAGNAPEMFDHNEVFPEAWLGTVDHPRERRDGDGGGAEWNPRHGEHVLPAPLPCKEQQRGHAGNGEGKQTFGEEGESSGDAGKR